MLLRAIGFELEVRYRREVSIKGLFVADNFSLINDGEGYTLAPAYDMVATTLVNPIDDEDMALTLNGKKKKLKRVDFIAAFNKVKLDAKQQNNIFNKMEKAHHKWEALIDNSFLSTEYKQTFKELIQDRFNRINA